MSDPSYRFPALYDMEYADFSSDVDHYVNIAKERGGPILELGIGNGRIALPVARAGVTVHGVDYSRAMLADLSAKLERESQDVASRISTWFGDIRRLSVPQRYDTVFLPFNTIHHCATADEVDQMLRSVDRALNVGGRFFLDGYLPDPILHGAHGREMHAHRDFIEPASHRPVHRDESSEFDPASRIHHLHYSYECRGHRPVELDFRLRVYTHDELVTMVDKAGFEVRREWGSFDGEPLTPTSTKWIAELARRGE